MSAYARTGRVRLAISKGGSGAGERVGAPLFTGELIASREGQEDNFDQDIHRLHVRLSLNPTRYLAHQQHSRRVLNLPASEWNLPPPSLYRRAVVRRTALEVALDANDNVLLTGAAQAHGRPAAWPLHVERYWSAVNAELESAFQEAADNSDATVQRRAYTSNVQGVETYWEFASADATALVVDLEPLLIAIGQDPEVRSFDFPSGETVSERLHNARSVRIRLDRGILLRVYAKTTRRVRFEIVHDLQKQDTRRYIRHELEELGDLLPLLNRSAAVAADALNSVLQRLEEQWFFPDGSLPLHNLLLRISQALPDERNAHAALSLVANNGVVVTTANEPLRPVIEALCRCEVLVRSGRRAYVVAPLFRRALADLRGQRRRERRQQSE